MVSSKFIPSYKLLLILGGAILLLSLSVIMAMAQTGTVLRVDPDSAEVAVNETVEVNIQLDNVTDLSAADVVVTFDSEVLQVEGDADSGRDGVQVAHGNFLKPDFVVTNMVVNSSGIITYVILQLGSDPINGSGSLFSVQFRGIKDGVGNITIRKAELATNQGQGIEATLQNGQIAVGSGGDIPATATPTPAPTNTPEPGETPTTPPIPEEETNPTATPPPANVTPTPPPDGEVIKYVVQARDTLFSIARRFNTTVLAIARYNNLYNLNFILAGQTLLIPNPNSPPKEIAYTIRRGDTLFSIGRRYGVMVQQLVEHNNIVNPNLIFAGEVIRIPQ